MASRRREPWRRSTASSSPRTMEMWLLPFAAMFTRPSWLNAVALATGALLCLNRRTVCAALRAVDGSADKGFSRFHRFLSRAEWSGLRGARILLGQLQKAFVPEGEPLVIAVDDSVERRRGAKIRDKGIWRDAVRSSRGFFVKVAGLRWLSLQVVVRPGFASRTWGLPFLTILSRSEQADARRKRRHQTLPEKATWAMRLVARWCSGPTAGDGGGWRLRQPGCVLDAARARGVRGALPDGRALLQPTAAAQEGPERQAACGRHPPADAADAGGAESHDVGAHDRPGMADEGRPGRAGGRRRNRQRRCGARTGKTMPVRWVLTRDPAGRAETRVFVCSDPEQSALQILTWYAMRWAVEPTFQESPTPPWVRDPAPVVGSGDPPNHAVAARPVLAGDLVGR